MNDTILSAKNLRKTFVVNKKETVEAVKGVSLDIKKGQIFGFLGPNGAGKTTTLRMLCTLLPITGGRAKIAGLDVQKQPGEVRKHIGYVSQLGGADDESTGRNDLLLQGQLYGMSKASAQKRAAGLIEALQLSDFADRKVSTYSGGQRRRLDVATGIMNEPDILFLDEPTTGLDPQNRANMWDQIRSLRDEGTTIFLTTHYLEEADVLCDQLAIMDYGKIVANGTPRQLKQQIAGDAIILRLKHGRDRLEKTREFLSKQSFVREARIEDEAIRLYVEDGTKVLPTVFSLLENQKVELETVSLSQPSLDDVFLKQTGRSLRDAGKDKE